MGQVSIPFCFYIRFDIILVIEQTILVEASLAQLRVEHHQDEDRPLLDVAQVQPLRRQLESALHASSTDTDPLYNEVCNIKYT